ncbi:MAG: signal peptidase I, partial [Patescibacteria group bacterium]
MKDLQKNNNKEEVVDFIKTIIIAGAVMLFVRFFIVQPFVVKGSSMEPNFYEKDYLIVDEISYRFSNPNRGDIIVFNYNDGIKREYLIKRIVGLPGDT